MLLPVCHVSVSQMNAETPGKSTTARPTPASPATPSPTAMPQRRPAAATANVCRTHATIVMRVTVRSRPAHKSP